MISIVETFIKIPHAIGEELKDISKLIPGDMYEKHEQGYAVEYRILLGYTESKIIVGETNGAGREVLNTAWILRSGLHYSSETKLTYIGRREVKPEEIAIAKRNWPGFITDIKI